MKKAKYVKYLIILCMIILIGIILFLVFNQELHAQNKLEEIMVSNDMEDDLVLPKGLYKLGAEYDGRLSTEIICKAYNNLAVNIIPKYYKQCKDLDDNSLTKLFEKNKHVIYLELGYDNVLDFKDLISSLKTLKTDTLKFENYELNGDSLLENSNNFSIYLSIKYVDNTELLLNSYVNKKKTTDTTPIILKADASLDKLQKIIEEKEKLEKEKAKNSVNNTTKQNRVKVQNTEVPKSGKVF